MKITTFTVDSGHPGVWPNGEPQVVRDAYDRLLAEQNAAPKDSATKAGTR